jgi:hypothetical protein
MTEPNVEVRLVGGPPDWDGKTMSMPESVVYGPREMSGTYLITAHPPERPEDEDPDPRAVYLPDSDGDPTVWRFRGWFPASASDAEPE